MIDHWLSMSLLSKVWIVGATLGVVGLNITVSVAQARGKRLFEERDEIVRMLGSILFLAWPSILALLVAFLLGRLLLVTVPTWVVKRLPRPKISPPPEQPPTYRSSPLLCERCKKEMP